MVRIMSEGLIRCRKNSKRSIGVCTDVAMHIRTLAASRSMLGVILCIHIIDINADFEIFMRAYDIKSVCMIIGN